MNQGCAVGKCVVRRSLEAETCPAGRLCALPAHVSSEGGIAQR